MAAELVAAERDDGDGGYCGCFNSWAGLNVSLNLRLEILTCLIYMYGVSISTPLNLRLSLKILQFIELLYLLDEYVKKIKKPIIN